MYHTQECCQKLTDAYPDDLNSNLSSELQQFHSYVQYKFSTTKDVKVKFSHADLDKVIIEDNIECAFPNVEICLRIFLTLMVTNCATERSFSQLKPGFPAKSEKKIQGFFKVF